MKIRMMGIWACAFASLSWSAGEKNVRIAALSYTPAGSAPVDSTQAAVDQYKKRTADALERAIRQTAKGGDVRLIVTPEFSTVGYPDIPDLPEEEDNFQNPEQARPYAETLTGPTVARFARLAKELDTYLIIGILEREGQNLFNTVVALGPNGRVVSSYRKINLFSHEAEYVQAGKSRAFFDTPFGRVGMTICYDIHFDHPARDLVSQDHIDIMAFPTSWVGKGGLSAFRSFARSNRVYFLAANHNYFPDTAVISPDGTVQSHTQSDEAVFGTVPAKPANALQKTCDKKLK
jgi:predicted amidohydrolase